MVWFPTVLIFILCLSYGQCNRRYLDLHEDQIARPNPVYLGRKMAIYCRLPSDDVLAKESNHHPEFIRASIKKIRYIAIAYEKQHDGYNRISMIVNDGKVEIDDSEKFPGITAYKRGIGPDLFLRIEFRVTMFHYRRFKCAFHLQTAQGFLLVTTYLDVTQKFNSILDVNPIRIGEKMRLRCTLQSIGGIDRLTGIGALKELHHIILSRRPVNGSNTNVQFLAKLDPHNTRLPRRHEQNLKGVTYVWTVRVHDETPKDQIYSVDRYGIKMTIASASSDDLGTYMCEFKYYTLGNPHFKTRTKVFSEQVQLFDELPRLVNLVTPNPVVIHKPMTVECSVKSIGGIDMLAGIGPNEYISNITLFQILPNKTLRIATYCALYYVYARRFSRPLPAGVKEEDLYMSGGGAGAKANLTMKVPRALIEHVTPYMCEFSYFLNINTTNWQKWTKRFTGIRPKVDKSEMMFAVGRANGKLQVPDILLAVTLGLCQLLRHV